MTIRVGVLGAGAWAAGAHLPGFVRDPRCELVAIADPTEDRAAELARQFGIPNAYRAHESLLARNDIDLVDICTPSATHFALAMAALKARKHVLCEKPVADAYDDTRRAAALAQRYGLKTKLGFTFRYSPAVRYAKQLIDDGFIGQPLIFNAYEQNSQWLDPLVPLRQEDHEADPSVIQVSSLQSYGAPVMDIAHLFIGSRFREVVGIMKNFVPDRVVRATGRMMRMNIDDADIFVGAFDNGALGSIQTSYVTVGNYPGVEARVYGTKGALSCRLIEEGGLCETLRLATIDDPEWRDAEVPADFYPPQGTPYESWRTLYYANLISAFISEILDDRIENVGNFEDGAHVQELINAVDMSCRSQQWVSLPLANAQ